MTGPYATAAELADYWRTLTVDEVARATTLLQYAGDLIDERPGAGGFAESATRHVSLDMVKRAMIGGGGQTSGSQAMADITVTVQYANPMGNLYITERELRRLRGYPHPAGSLVPTSNARVPYQIWNRQRTRYGHDDDGCTDVD